LAEFGVGPNIQEGVTLDIHAGNILCSVAVLALLALGLSAGASIPTGKDLERAVASASRPFVLLDEQELAALRKAVQSDGPKRAAYLQPMGEGESEYAGAGVLAIANRWLKADIRIPAHGGHAHYFFCDCGTQLTLPDDLQPRPEYTCPACGKKYSGERFDAAVRCFKHHQLANAALHLAVAYGIEQNRKYSDKAAEILRKYAEVYPGPHTSPTAGGILFQSLNEAMWIIPLAQAYDLIYDSGSLSAADKKSIEDRLFRPAAEGIRASGLGGNWGSWHLSAVGVVGFAIRDAGMVEYAIKAFQAQISGVLGEDGLWPESVHCYHFFPLQAFVFFTEASARAGIDLYNWEAKPGKSLKSMFTAPLEYMYPNFQLPAINDGWYAAWLPLNLYEVARRRWDDPAFAWALDAGYEVEAEAQKTVLTKSMSHLGGAPLYGFLLGPEQPEKPAAPVFKSTNFDHFGLCTLRNENTMLTFHYGRFLGHGHLDKLSFTLYSNNTLLAPDYGTPGYGSQILHWYQSTESHNTVVVDGKSQARSAENATDAFFSGKLAQFAQATSKEIYPGVTQTRKILLIGNACFIVDDLASPNAHQFDWLIHCEGFPWVSSKHTPAKIDTSAYPNVAFGRTDHISHGYRVNWKSPTCDLAFGIWCDGADVGLGKCPAETDARHASMLMCRKRGRKVRFVAALLPTKPGSVSQLTRTGGLIQASYDGQTYYLGTGPGGQGELTTDGELAAVRVSNGEVTGAVLVHGSWLKWQGKTLIERASKVGCAEL
jgi:hypothetical protein